jgi:hypothetical protein
MLRKKCGTWFLGLWKRMTLCKVYVFVWGRFIAASRSWSVCKLVRLVTTTNLLNRLHPPRHHTTPHTHTHTHTHHLPRTHTTCPTHTPLATIRLIYLTKSLYRDVWYFDSNWSGWLHGVFGGGNQTTYRVTNLQFSTEKYHRAFVIPDPL